MFENEYKSVFSKVTASGDTYRRVMNMTRETKKHGSAGMVTKILIAAVMVSLLVVTASASEAVRNWLSNYFFSETGEPLSQEQVLFLEENEKRLDESLVRNDWTIELRSAITDGMKGYILLGITAPEGTSLEEIPGKSQGTYYGPGNDFLLKSEDAVLHCSAYPDFGGVVGNIQCRWGEDGDGRSNTVNYVIDVAPDVEWAEEDPFGADTMWSIHIQNLVSGFPEQTVLAEGTWDFEFTFEYDNTKVRILNEPVKTRAWAYLPDGAEIESEVTITSMALRPFGITLYYGDASDGLDYSRTSVQFTDSMTSRYPWYVVMKDGRKIEMYTAGGNPIERYAYLAAAAPIVLDDVDFLLLSDGTELAVP